MNCPACQSTVIQAEGNARCWKCGWQKAPSNQGKGARKKGRKTARSKMESLTRGDSARGSCSCTLGFAPVLGLTRQQRDGIQPGAFLCPWKREG